MGKRDLLWLTAIFIFIFISLASAEVLVGQVEPLYNVGDTLDVNISLSSSVGINDFLTAKLVCGSGDIDIYKSPYNLNPNEYKSIQVSAKLDSLLTRNLGGVCYISAFYGGETAESQKFDISKRVDVQFTLDSIADPGKEILISGYAKKSNGEFLNGFVEVEVANLRLSSSGIVNNGNFSLLLAIPKNAPSGSYEIIARVYDKDNSKVTANEGSAEGVIRVKQIIESIDIAIDKLEVTPGKDNVTFSVLLFDQAGNQAQKEAEVSIYDSKSVLNKTILAISGRANTFVVGFNYPSGYWTINAQSGDLKIEKSFYVNEFENISYSVINDTLTFFNTGNMPINRLISVSVGDVSEVKEISLEVGAVKKFKLTAPNGNYAVSIASGNESYNLGSTFLTGKAVSIIENKEVFGNNLPFWIWALVIIALCLIVLYLYKKNAKRNYYGKVISSSDSDFRKFNPKESPEVSKNVFKKAVAPAIRFKEDKIKAAKEGAKEGSIAVALKLKNYNEIKSAGADSLSVIDRIVLHARSLKARVHDEGDCKIIIFSSRLTKEEDNKMRALKFARSVEQFLEEHNKKHALKIKYGLGVHIGEMIVESIDGKFKFSALGTTIITAKRAAERSKGEVILSHAFHSSARKFVKDEPLQGENFWRLRSIVDRSEHEEFIAKFMKKQSFKE